MNYTTLMIKLIGKPKKGLLETDIPVTELVGKFYQFRKNKYTVCKILVWGNLASDLLSYYDPNDYLIVEGHISLQDSIIEDLNLKTTIQVSAYKVFPYSLRFKSKEKDK
uniref:Single-stranded DNA binding protein n=1 Tax=Chaetoceros pseudocurvisetus TaxID=426637 RepID=A0A8F5PN92_9STRA|nr:hypothetical protein Ycf41 [Chaetoceros pseudocurvisetus]